MKEIIKDTHTQPRETCKWKTAHLTQKSEDRLLHVDTEQSIIRVWETFSGHTCKEK